MQLLIIYEYFLGSVYMIQSLFCNFVSVKSKGNSSSYLDSHGTRHTTNRTGTKTNYLTQNCFLGNGQCLYSLSKKKNKTKKP